MFPQDRKKLRAFYSQAWEKHRHGLPMEPLEIRRCYCDASGISLGCEEQAGRRRKFAGRGRAEQSFLHMGLHLAIRDQLATDRPAGFAGLYRNIGARCRDIHEAEHRLMDTLAESIWTAQRQGLPPDEKAYLDQIRRLAGNR